jgi:ABC transporter C-terminal domain
VSYSVEALSEALRDWGNDATNENKPMGAFVVISHDRDFCDRIEFTHVATVQDGVLRLEERNARESDWQMNDLGAASGTSEHGNGVGVATSTADVPELKLSDKDRKRVFNAPKRISKLERLVEQADTRMVEIDSVMMANGSDVAKLVDLAKEKQELEGKVVEYMKEWEELEELLARIGGR